MMNATETIRSRACATVDALVRKAYRIIDDAEDQERALTHSDVECLLACWKTIHLALEISK